MLNLNTLYNAVFKPERRKLDPARDYYTILMDTPDFLPFYTDLRGRLDQLMSEDAYTFMHAENAPLSQNEADEKLSQITEMLDMRTNGMAPPRRFCLMAYFDDDHKDTAYLPEMISWLGAMPNDVVTVFVVLSKNMAEKGEFLNELGNALGHWAKVVDLYVFTDAFTQFYRRGLVHSLCGAIVMNVGVTDYQRRKSRKSAAENMVDAYVDAMAADGQESITKHCPIKWSSIYCRYYDRQYDFLNQYVSNACENVRGLTKDDFLRVADEAYQQVIPQRTTVAVESIVKNAVSYIPHVTANSTKVSMSTLRYYFDQLYGDSGAATVELTLKVTLAGLFNYRVEELARECSELIFEKCAVFATKNLYNNLLGLLEDYIATFRKSCDNIAKTIQLSLDDDMPEEARTSHLNDYLKKYIELYTRQKALSFWEEVLRLVRSHPEYYDAICRKSEDYFQELEDVKKSLPANSIYVYDISSDRTYSTGELMNLESDAASCALIREKFNRAQGGAAGAVAPADCNMVFNVPIAPHFYKGETVQMETASYTLAGYEINGKYFVTMGAE